MVSNKQRNLVPPDGGWGWIIMMAYALNNLVFIPIMQSFGLIFRKTFEELNLSAAQGSVILTSNASFGMIMGFMNGPLLKRFSYRQVAIAGSILITGGVLLTSVASEFYQIVVTYGIITSLGIGIGMASYSLALNTYFLKNRGKAVGFAFTLTSIGTIFVPQLISYLMSVYTVHGTILIMGGIASHTLIAALLLQPIKWHMKREPKSETNDQDESKIALIDDSTSINNSTVPSPKQPKKCADKFETSKDEVLFSKIDDKEDAIPSRISLVYNPEMSVQIKKKNGVSRFIANVVDYFDLALLKDYIYVNIMLGMSIAVFAEMNFSLLTPFILSDLGFNTQMIATFMSVLSAADLLCRFFSPFVGDYLRKTPRVVYMVSLILLIVGRSLLIIFDDYGLILFAAAFLGLTKGVRTVYMALVIPGYVPLEKLPAATGLQMVVNGLLIIAGGPFLGLLRDKTGSYSQSIIIMNVMTGITVVMWSIEMILIKLRSKDTKVELVEENG